MPFFVMLVLLSRPVVRPALAYTLIIVGIVIRLWAAGYIGVSARTASFDTRYRITDGPYRFLKHPLYAGNLLLVTGVTILFNPPLFFALSVTVLYIVIYGMIIMSEHLYIMNLPEKKADFQFKNCAGEISTSIVVVVILLIHIFVPKNLL